LGGGVIRRKIRHNTFDEIVSIENLFRAWREFSRGKRQRLDVQQFEFNLEDNLFRLHYELESGAYHHSDYTSFYVQDPKLRHIHKACVWDRVLHQAVFRVLDPIFDRKFIFDSYSCRLNKGTHKAVNRLKEFSCRLSGNNHKNIFALKCDIRKFFDSIDQSILLSLIEKRIQDKRAIVLVSEIIKSFEKATNKGLPLGNVTSQLFANIYLNELDQFAKHRLKAKYYLRYCDDFIILGGNKNGLINMLYLIDDFLKEKLKLDLYFDKVDVRKYHQGIDFLGYAVLPHHRVLRTKTKRRMFRKMKKRHQDFKDGLVSEESFNQSIQSYLGVLIHCQGYRIKKDLMKMLK